MLLGTNSRPQPAHKTSDSYTKKFPTKKRKTNSINYIKNNIKEKQGPNSSRHIRTTSKANILPPPNSLGSGGPQKVARSKRSGQGKKGSKSNPRKEKSNSSRRKYTLWKF